MSQAKANARLASRRAWGFTFVAESGLYAGIDFPSKLQAASLLFLC